MPGKASIENGKLGGRPVGKKSKATLEKEAVLKAFNQRIFQIADSLLDPQISLAKGQRFLYKIEKTKVVGPKGGITYRNEKPQQVTSETEIQAYLNDLVDRVNGDLEDNHDPGAVYYYITAKEPNNMAIDSLFNRALGKPIESVELSGKNGDDIKLQHGIQPALDKIYGKSDSSGVPS